MKPKRPKTPATLIYDGARWRLPGQAPVAAAPDAPPRAWLDALAKTHAAVRFLLDGEIRRLDVALPPRTRWAEAQALAAQEIADQTGADPASLIPAGQPYGAGREVALLAVPFPSDRLASLRAAAEAAGLRFAGAASLSLAIAAVWRGQGGNRREALLVVGAGQTVVAPPAPSVPFPVSAGLRHAAMGASVWLERFTQGARILGAEAALRVVALGEAGGGLAETLREAGGFPDVRALDAEACLAEAASLVAGVRPNRLGVAVPVVNPWEPRKRFSNAWIVAPCLLILALPFLYSGGARLGLRADERRYRAEAARYLPLERATEAAQRRRDAAQRALDAESAAQRALAERRRPLAAFVQVAYFFCKHAGATVVLDGLTERDGVVSVAGSYVDDEEGLRLREALTAFAEAEGLRLVDARDEAGVDGEGLPLTRFAYTIDCTRMGGVQ